MEPPSVPPDTELVVDGAPAATTGDTAAVGESAAAAAATTTAAHAAAADASATSPLAAHADATAPVPNEPHHHLQEASGVSDTSTATSPVSSPDTTAIDAGAAPAPAPAPAPAVPSGSPAATTNTATDGSAANTPTISPPASPPQPRPSSPISMPARPRHPSGSALTTLDDSNAEHERLDGGPQELHAPNNGTMPLTGSPTSGALDLRAPILALEPPIGVDTSPPPSSPSSEFKFEAKKKRSVKRSGDASPDTAALPTHRAPRDEISKKQQIDGGRRKKAPLTRPTLSNAKELVLEHNTNNTLSPPSAATSNNGISPSVSMPSFLGVDSDYDSDDGGHGEELTCLSARFPEATTLDDPAPLAATQLSPHAHSASAGSVAAASTAASTPTPTPMPTPTTSTPDVASTQSAPVTKKRSNQFSAFIKKGISGVKSSIPFHLHSSSGGGSGSSGTPSDIPNSMSSDSLSLSAGSRDHHHHHHGVSSSVTSKLKSISSFSSAATIKAMGGAPNQSAGNTRVRSGTVVANHEASDNVSATDGGLDLAVQTRHDRSNTVTTAPPSSAAFSVTSTPKSSTPSALSSAAATSTATTASATAGSSSGAAAAAGDRRRASTVAVGRGGAVTLFNATNFLTFVSELDPQGFDIVGPATTLPSSNSTNSLASVAASSPTQPHPTSSSSSSSTTATTSLSSSTAATTTSTADSAHDTNNDAATIVPASPHGRSSMRNVWKLRVDMVSTLLPGLEQGEAPKRIIKIEPNVSDELTPTQAVTALGIDNLHRIREGTFPSLLDLSDPRLQLHSDKFLAFVPDEFKEMNLSFNRLRSFSCGGHFSRVKRLFLNDNQLESLSLEGFSSLTVLSLANNQIQQLEGLGGAKRLIYLNLSGNPIKLGFRELAKLRSLRVLDLSFCEIPVHFDLQTLLAPLTRLRSLQYLSLFGNQVAQGSAKAKHTIISQLPKLQYYDYQLITKEMRDLSLSIATEEQISQQDKRDFINALVAAAPKKNRLLLLEQSTADDEGADGSAALPPALWRHIFQLLPTRDLVALSASCSRFNAICTDIRRSIEVSQLTQITIVHSVHEPSWLLALIASFPAFERYSIRTLRLEHYDEELLRREKAVLLLLSHHDRELWRRLYEQVSHRLQQRVSLFHGGQSNSDASANSFQHLSFGVIDLSATAHLDRLGYCLNNRVSTLGAHVLAPILTLPSDYTATDAARAPTEDSMRTWLSAVSDSITKRFASMPLATPLLQSSA